MTLCRAERQVALKMGRRGLREGPNNIESLAIRVSKQGGRDVTVSDRPYINRR